MCTSSSLIKDKLNKTLVWHIELIGGLSWIKQSLIQVNEYEKEWIRECNVNKSNEKHRMERLLHKESLPS